MLYGGWHNIMNGVAGIINPYKEEVFINQKYYKDAVARAEITE